MSNEALAPPADGTPRPLRALVEVSAGVAAGVPDPAWTRSWVMEDVPDLYLLRGQLADRLTEAYAYARTLPFPEQLHWYAVYAVWR